MSLADAKAGHLFYLFDPPHQHEVLVKVDGETLALEFLFVTDLARILSEISQIVVAFSMERPPKD
ncbi:MAG: hypothetical protein KDA80_04860 [Planctomycetaceae bacterium]|nr:hypothetical protein [Planctomycetaceae bacterium]